MPDKLIMKTPALVWTISLLGVVGLYEGWNLATDHLGSASFSDHAKFHAVLSGIYLGVLSLVLLGLVTALRAGKERIQLLLLVFVLLALPGAPLLAVAMVPAGAPPAGALGVAVVALAVGLAVSAFMFIRMKRPGAPN